VGLAALLAILAGLMGTARSSAPLDAPVSIEPRVVVAKCLSSPGLVTSKGNGQRFMRAEKGDELYSRDLLLAIPGFKVDVEPVTKSVKLTLWGNLPGLSESPVLESSVVLHDSRAYDLDFTLVRGRVLLTNTRKKGPAKVWLRGASGVELVLPEPGDQVALELFGRWPAGVPFSHKHKPGEEPVRLWEVHCLKGNLEIKADQTQWNMSAPPGPAYFHGDSVEGPARGGPERRNKLPEWADPKAPVPPLAKTIAAVVAAYTGKIESRDPEEVGVELMVRASKDKNKDRARVTRQLIVSAMAAQDQVGRVANLLNNSPHDEVRKMAVVTLRHWIGGHHGRDEKLYEKLQSEVGFTKNEAEAVMQLLHSPFDPAQPETYEALIAYLKHRRQAVRELAAWHLYRLAPLGRKIPFDAGAPIAERDKAAEAWKKLIPSGELPKEPPDETKEKEKPKEKEADKPKETEKPKKTEKRGEQPGKEEAAAQAKEALLVVRVATNATLTVDGDPTTSRGMERRFLTPPLKHGVRYHYLVSATWSASPSTTITRTRKAFVFAGKTTELDLRVQDPAWPDKIVVR
jgi:uncharacterized protein (TIGR03000 family)